MHYSMGRHTACIKLGMDPRLLGAGLGAGLGGAAGALGGGEDNRLAGGLAGAAVGGGLGALTPAMLGSLLSKGVTNQSGRGPMYSMGGAADDAAKATAELAEGAHPPTMPSLSSVPPPTMPPSPMSSMLPPSGIPSSIPPEPAMDAEGVIAKLKALIAGSGAGSAQ